jgi:hypothetical protein
MSLSWDNKQGLFVGSPSSATLMVKLVALVYVAIFLLILLMSTCTPAFAQATNERQWYIAVDTAGISRVAPHTYVTWVFAKATPTAFPSSGIIVAWDCKARKVKRLAQVKYHLSSDSTTVTGDIEEVNQPWVPVSDERMYTLVCAIGATRPNSVIEPVIPKSSPPRLRQPTSDA